MNKPTNTIKSGWMTKSPPEQKLSSHLKIFRAKWKQRYFVLHKPAGSLPDQYELSYYSSEQCSKKKGTIDLGQCEQIIESLDSDQYPYLLAVKTICRNKVRTYYLATNSEQDMSSWVQCLCRVCGLKQEDTPTDIPGSRLSEYGVSNSSTVASTPLVNNTAGQSVTTPAPTITSQPAPVPPSRAATVTSSSSSGSSHPLPSTSPQSYVFLNECTTGTAEKRSEHERADSIDSVPEYLAPPPPIKKGSHVLNNNTEDISKNSLHDSVFDVYDRPPPAGGQETYDRPRSGFQDVYDRPRSGELPCPHGGFEGNDFYKVPPGPCGQTSLNVTRGSMSTDAIDLNAAVPLPVPRRSPRSARSSLSERADSVDFLVENYDVPPPRPSLPSQDEDKPEPPPPQRPPKPHNLMASSMYQNLPSNSSEHEENSLSAVPSAPPSFCPAALSYDVPRSSSVVSPPRESSILDIAPPRPAPRTNGSAGAHAYLNTAPALPPLPEPHLPARQGEKRGAEVGQGDSGSPLPSPCKPTMTEYANMSGGRGKDNQDLYQVPPVAPRTPARATTMPAHRVVEQASDVEAHYIWSNTRTKSFKRNNQVKMSSGPARPPPLDHRPPPLPTRSDFASSSDDEDDISVDGVDTHVDPRVLRMSTVPAPPEPDMDPELKYLDLALETPPDLSRPQAAASQSRATEYREIDFVRTRALQDTKNFRMNMEK